MNKKILCATFAAALACAAVGPAVRADDSNPLRKAGKAIAYPIKKAAGNASKTANKGGQAVQYPVRKTGENASVTAHRAVGKKSVIRRRPQKHDAIVTPKGKVHPLPPNP